MDGNGKHLAALELLEQLAVEKLQFDRNPPYQSRNVPRFFVQTYLSNLSTHVHLLIGKMELSFMVYLARVFT